MVTTEDKDEEKQTRRRLTEKDWKVIEQHVKDTLDQRKRSDFRTFHETIWREVDRQIAMRPLTKTNRDQSSDEQGWHNVFELGELARASELVSADVRRHIFPDTRDWFESHAEIQFPLDVQTGRPMKDPAKQRLVDGSLRALMTQQHEDFGLKDRFDLSVKEALHHGSFVATVEMESMMMVYEGTKVKEIAAPVWVPHSMWNCYPDPSPSIIGTNMYYNGSMIIESYIPRHKLKEMAVGEGWMRDRIKKVPKEEHEVKENRVKDVKLTTYWGDIVIDRTDGDDIYYPNHKAILANGKVVYFAPQKLPYPEIIYRGYEKMDIRDPYYTSPIIKFSPMHKMATILANRYIDAIELDIEPPVVYDGNDADLVNDGGPRISPAAKIASKTGYQIKYLESGDPNAALQGLQLAMNYLQENLGRPGAEIGDRATAAEVQKVEGDSEVGLVGFLDKLQTALRSYLYMQHELNKREMTEYSLFNKEMGQPDFMRLTKKALPSSVHFEVVGVRGILGEQKRTEQASMVTAMAVKVPIFASLLKPAEILKQMYQDAGVKAPEAFIKTQQEMGLPPEVQMMVRQLQMQLQKLMQAYQQVKAGHDVKLHKIDQDNQVKILKIAADLEKSLAKLDQDHAQHLDKMAHGLIELSLNNQQQEHAAGQAQAGPAS